MTKYQRTLQPVWNPASQRGEVLTNRTQTNRYLLAVRQQAGRGQRRLIIIRK